MAHENVYFSNGNYERMLKRNAELYLKEATVIYGLQPLAARYARPGVKVGKTSLLPLVLL